MFVGIKLENFKAWKTTGEEIVDLKPVTMLLGTNSSGKSSLIQSFLLLKQTIQSPDRTVHLNLGGDEVNDLFNFGDFDDLLYQGTSERSIKMNFCIENDKMIGLDYVQNANRNVVVDFMSQIKGKSDKYRAFTVARREKGTYSLIIDRVHRNKGAHLTPERSIGFSAEAAKDFGEDWSFYEDLSLSLRREFENIVYLGPLRRKPERDYVWNRSMPGNIGSDGHRAIDVLLASALLKDEQRYVIDGVSKWLNKMGVAERIDVKQMGRSTRYELVIERDGVISNLRDVGIGVSQVLPVLTVAYFAPEGSTIILEEPEIHLHPLAQTILAELFVEVSRERKVQFIVETHSEHLFRRMQTLMAQQKTDAEQCAMYFVEREAGAAKLRKLDLDEFGAVKNWPENFFGDSVGEARAQAQARLQRKKEQAQNG